MTVRGPACSAALFAASDRNYYDHMTHALCPGSFDPVTLGHIDVLTAASRLFARLTVLVVHNPDKQPWLALDQRARLLRRACDDAGIVGVEIDLLSDGLLADYCKGHAVDAVVKGLRSGRDLDYELPMAEVNRDLCGVETVFLPARPEHTQLSSSLVRTLARLGGDYSRYVPPAVADLLRHTD